VAKLQEPSLQQDPTIQSAKPNSFPPITLTRSTGERDRSSWSTSTTAIPEGLRATRSHGHFREGQKIVIARATITPGRRHQAQGLLPSNGALGSVPDILRPPMKMDFVPGKRLSRPGAYRPARWRPARQCRRHAVFIPVTPLTPGHWRNERRQGRLKIEGMPPNNHEKSLSCRFRNADMRKPLLAGPDWPRLLPTDGAAALGINLSRLAPAPAKSSPQSEVKLGHQTSLRRHRKKFKVLRFPMSG